MTSNNFELQDASASIPDYFAGKTIAITGSTGFLGQLLIEKLLRSCPNIKKIYVLLRSKKDVSSKERLNQIVNLPIFDSLRKTWPTFSEKLNPLMFDLEDEHLGLSDNSYDHLISEVNLFFHSAATLKFNEHLRLSLKVNTIAVKKILKLCQHMTQLEALIHVSTAYSYCNYKTIEEEVYPTGWDYDKLYDAMQWMSDDMIAKCTPEILGKRPNTYTLTKAFGEEVIVKEGFGLPVCIVRPSVIGSTNKDPIPGWCANVNGPTGMFIAYAKGCLRILCNSSDYSMDVMPADHVVNGVIAAAWKTAVTAKRNGFKKASFSTNGSLSLSSLPSNAELKCYGYTKPTDSEEVKSRRKTIPVYNLVANTGKTVTITMLCNMVCESFAAYPVENVFRPPHLITWISNRHVCRLVSFFLEYIPAFLFDVGRVLSGRKPTLLRLTHRMVVTMDVLNYFFKHSWMWSDGNVKLLERSLSADDKKASHVDSLCSSIRVTSDVASLPFKTNIPAGSVFLPWKVDPEISIKASKAVLNKKSTS